MKSGPNDSLSYLILTLGVLSLPHPWMRDIDFFIPFPSSQLTISCDLSCQQSAHSGHAKWFPPFNLPILCHVTLQLCHFTRPIKTIRYFFPIKDYLVKPLQSSTPKIMSTPSNSKVSTLVDSFPNWFSTPYVSQGTHPAFPSYKRITMFWSTRSYQLQRRCHRGNIKLGLALVSTIIITCIPFTSLKELHFNGASFSPLA